MHEIGVVRSMVKTVLDIGELSLVIPKYVEDIYPVVVGGIHGSRTQSL